MRRAERHPLENELTLAGALLGLGLALLVAHFLRLRVSPDQPIGLAKLHGFNPRSDVIRFGLVCLATVAGAASGRHLSRISADLLRTRATKLLHLSSWPRLGLLVFACSAVMALLYRVPVRWQLIVDWTGWLALGGALALTRGARSERTIGLASAVAHALTVWIFLAAAGAEAGVSCLSLGALLLALSIFEGYWLGGRDLERGAPSLALSALTFPVAFWSHRTETACLLAGFSAVILPLIGPRIAGLGSRARMCLRLFAVVVFLPGSVAALGAAACLHTPPMGSLFEDGHGLLPASEYFRGELPYRDIVPAHGLVSDGLIQVVELKVFGDDYRGLARGSKVVGAFFWPAIYCVGAAATGSAALGFWGVCLSFLVFPQFLFFRVMASLASLVLASRAARIGRPQAWLVAGAALTIALLFALDFGVYAGAAAVAALFVSRGARAINVRRFVLGAAACAALIAILFAGLGILRSFLYYTFVFVPRLLPVYALGIPPPPQSVLGSLPSIELFTSLLDQNALYYWLLPVALLLAAILLARAPTVGARGRALLPLLVWFCAATLSILERQHFGYALFVAPTAVLLLARWVKGYRPWRSARGWLAGAIVAVLILATRPFGFVTAVVSGLASSQPPSGAVALGEPPRVRGTLFPREEALVITATGAFLQSNLPDSGDTWLDFSNAPLLYYLFDRDCPIPYYEVPLYETQSAQGEVIAAITRNKRVKAVLMRTGRLSDAIDGISNGQRAPLVLLYIQREFHPAFAKDGVEFWLRNPADGEARSLSE